MLALVAAGASAACSGSGASAPTGGFSQECQRGPRLGGTAEMGVSNRGLHTDLDDMTISIGGGTGATCAGASYERDR